MAVFGVLLGCGISVAGIVRFAFVIVAVVMGVAIGADDFIRWMVAKEKTREWK